MAAFLGYYNLMFPTVSPSLSCSTPFFGLGDLAFI